MTRATFFKHFDLLAGHLTALSSLDQARRHAFVDDATVRDRVIDRIASQWSVSLYARGFARRHVTLLARRVQAELRTMDECRFDRLAPWLEDGVTIDTDGAVQPPAWAREPEDQHPDPGQLRCVR